MKSFVLAALAIPVALSFSSRVSAQSSVPEGTAKIDNASSGKTEVGSKGFAAAAKPAAGKDATDLAISLGGLFMSGNAKTVAATGSTTFRLRREMHQFSAAAAANYARSGKTGTPVETSAENLQGLLRYDAFFNLLDLDWSGFLQGQARRDRFQGLDLRLNIDPGVAHYFIDSPKQRLWIELGYDVQYDIRRQEDVDKAAATGQPVDKTKTFHNVRSYAGYENKLYQEISFVTGFEYLQNVEEAKTYRLIFNTGLKSQIADKLSFSTTYSLRFENNPLPAVEKTDSVAAINLIYTLL